MPSSAKKRLTSIIVSTLVFFVGILLNLLEPVKDIPVHIFAYIVAYFIVVARDILLFVKCIKSAKLLEETFLVITVSILSAYMGEYLIAFAVAWLYSFGELFVETAKSSMLSVQLRNIYTLVSVVIALFLAIIPVFCGVEFSVSFKISAAVFTVICPLPLAVLKAVKFIKSK